MKAKEYAQEYNSLIGQAASTVYQNAPQDAKLDELDALFCVCRKMIFEISSIAKQRHIQSNYAFIGVLREIKQKFLAFLKIIDKPNYHNALQVTLEETMPKLVPMMKSLDFTFD